MIFSRRTLMSCFGAASVASAPAAAAGSMAFLPASELGLKPDAGPDQSAAFQRALLRSSRRGGALLLEAGTYRVRNVRIERPAAICGMPGAKLVSTTGETIFRIEAPSVRLDQLCFEGRAAAAGAEQDLVAAWSSPDLSISECSFSKHGGNGLTLRQCSGHVRNNRGSDIGGTGIFALDSAGLDISGNRLRDIGNNGIQIWASEQRPDGTIVSGNRIERVRCDAGGTGQNGNGIVVFRAGNVIVSNNRVVDCAYSAIRNNSGRNCQIVNNNVSRLGETAIYVEFAFDGAVVSGNIVDKAAGGISITNLDQGGRLAVCANNVVRGITGGGSDPEKRGIAISAEADTVISGNVVEDAAYCGLLLGWGPYARNLLASSNLVRRCETAIMASVSEGAGAIAITGNMIAQSGRAMVGMDHTTVKTADLAAAAAPTHLTISGNVVS